MSDSPSIGNYPAVLPHEVEQQDKLKAGDASQPSSPTLPPATAPMGTPIILDPLTVTDPDVNARQYEVYKAAFQQESTLYSAIDEQKFDPDFKLTPELFKKVTQGLPEDTHKAFADAMSEDHAWAIRAAIEKYTQNEKTLSDAGWEGTTARMLTALVDPVNLAVTAGTSGVGDIVLGATKTARITRALTQGLAGVVMGAVPPAVKQAQEPWRNPADIAYAAAFGGILGFTAGAVHEAAPAVIKAAKGMANRVERDAIEQADLALTEKGLAQYHPEATPVKYEGGVVKTLDELPVAANKVEDMRGAYAETLTPMEAAARMEQLHMKSAPLNAEEQFFMDTFSKNSDVQYALDHSMRAPSELSPDETELLEKFRNGEFTPTKMQDAFDAANFGRSAPSEGDVADAIHATQTGPSTIFATPRPAMSGGAAANTTTQPLSAGATQSLYAANAPKTAFGRTRFDMVGRLKSSEHPLVRKLGAMLGMDAVGNVDHSVNSIAASEIQRLHERAWGTQFRKGVEPAYDAWTKEIGANGVLKSYSVGRRDTFFSLVTKEVRNPGSVQSPAVQKAANSLRELYADIGSTAQNPRAKWGGNAPSVRSFEQFAPNDTYVPRLVHDQRFHENVSTFGGFQVTKLVRGSLQRANSTWSPEILDKVAEGYVKGMRKLGAGMEMDFHMGVSNADTNLLRNMLDNSGMPRQEVDQFMNALESASPDKGVISRGKSRVNLDEGHYEYLTNKQTGNPEKVYLSDLFDDNAERITQRYIRQMSGAVGLAEHGIVDRASYAALTNEIRSTADQIGGKYSGQTMEKELKMMDTLYKSVAGQPLEESSGGVGQQVARIFRNYSFSRVMGQLGFAQIPDAGNIISEAGWSAVAKQVPEVRHILRDAQSGKLNSALLEEIESYWGFGSDTIKNKIGSGGADFGMSGDNSWNSYLAPIGHMSEKARKFTTDFSGFAETNAALQKMSALSAIQHFTDVAMGTTAEKSVQRLAMLGLDQPTAQKIYAQIRQHATLENSALFPGQTIKQINLHQWTDGDATSAFVHSINRWAGKVVQESDIGTLPMFMTKEMFKTFFQFRTFMATSWANQTLSALHQHDLTAAHNVLLATLLGGMTYAAQTSVNAIGRDDAQDYLQKRLDPIEIAKGAFNKAGYSSIVPFLVDSGSDLTAHKWYSPQFSFSRSSGLGTGLLGGSPAVDVLDKASTVVGAAGRLAFDSNYYLNKEDVGAMTGLIPFQRMMGLSNILQSMQNGLPSHAPRN